MSNQSQEPIDPQLAQIQRIEAGGPLKKVNVPHMPTWWRVLYYMFSTLLLLIGAAGVYLALTN